MKFISVIFLLVTLISCSVKKEITNNNFEKFKNKFPLISFPFINNDQIALGRWEKEHVIDTNFVMQYELTTKYVDNDNPKKNLSDYKCTYVGRYESKYYSVLIYKLFTSEAWGGKPKMILSTFSKEGKKIDELMALWTEPQTELTIQRIVLNLQDDRKIENRLITTNYGYLNGQKVQKKSSIKLVRYELNTNGKIIKTQESANDVFNDNNPKILEEIRN